MSTKIREREKNAAYVRGRYQVMVKVEVCVTIVKSFISLIQTLSHKQSVPL